MDEFLLAPINSLPNQRQILVPIVNFFIAVANSNDLRDTPAVHILQSVISDPQFIEYERFPTFNEVSCETRIAQQAPLEQRLELRTAILNDYPVLNLWDALSFVYSFYVEYITDDLRAQLHLFQLRTITCALRRCTYFRGFSGPTTVAATWTRSTSSTTRMIAFAATCVGNKESTNKRDMAQIRLTSLEKTLKITKEWIKEIRCHNRPGNCPETVLWGIVCQLPGNY
jgi:hypothetical protein